MAQDLDLPAAELRSHIAQWGRADCQVVDSRDSRSATVAFHPAPKRREVPPPDFQVGDRVRVTAQRPQYANCTGVITQTISVSCRVKLDNGWQAFLPYHCLEKLATESGSPPPN
ncbi:MAG: nitrile hydratase subunit beta [Oscillatoriales cyanobacterium SM2_1_8]|nr:nitrile hydratase subunit beta [Oscillatoriales cyanobacterium SM2_1_8]